MIALIFLIVSGTSLTAINSGDDAFIRQEYTAAISIYESALPAAENKSELLWRIARCYITMGDIAHREEREPLYRKADEFSKKGVEADSLNADAHCWRAISVGYIAIYEGVRAKVAAANDIKRSLDRALQLDPNNDVAYSILGTFYRALGKVGWIEKQLANLLLGGLPPGGFKEAEAALNKAIALAPTVIRHRFELGLLYLDMEQPDKAKIVFSEALKYPPLLASDQQRIERMKRRLNER